MQYTSDTQVGVVCCIWHKSAPVISRIFYMDKELSFEKW